MHRVPLSLFVLAVLAAGAGAAPVALPGGGTLTAVDFERHVVPLLGRAGCAAGACHGSFQGKGGLRLSLFGHQPEKDYPALTRDGLGRRIDRLDPERSLLLLKPTAQVPHEGGRRFAKNSWEYAVLREWIAQGMPWQPGSGTVTHLAITPGEQVFAGPEGSVSLKVRATFTDGTTADVTPFCSFRARDDFVAEVSSEGVVRALRPGDTVVIVSYRGNLGAARILVPAPAAASFVYPEVPENNLVDREVFAKLRRLHLVPSELSGDAEFLRRIYLDTVGTLPAPDEVRAFLVDPRSDKRERLIERLLAHPLHAALWATRFSDVTGNNVDLENGSLEARAQRARMWHAWLRRRFADNVPYDQLVRGILCATSRNGRDLESWMRAEAAAHDAGGAGGYAERPTLDLFWERSTGEDFFPLEQMGELTAAAFLGVRLQCAQCHKHPFDRWTQSDYRAYANVFGQVRYGSSNELRATMARLLEERRQQGRGDKPLPRLSELYVGTTAPRRLTHPDTGGSLPAKALGGPEISLEGGDARERLFAWMTRPDNPFFARALVNRVWAHYFGAGLVEPVDNFSVANPPTNERLLDALAAEFMRSGYDFRGLERLILNSRTYQLTSRPNASNSGDLHNGAHARVRRLLAEVVVDALNAALGTTEDLGRDAPRGAHAVEVAPSRVQAPHLAELFRVFGRPARSALCDCERPTEPALPQTLFLMTDPVLLKKIERGRLASLLASGRSDPDIVDELFLATLTRLPDDGERQAAVAHVVDQKDRKKGFVDIVWALVNTREFILNH